MARKAVITTNRPPPEAHQEPQILRLHGDKRIDHYAYLRKRSDPRVKAYIDAENAYSSAAAAELDTLCDQIFEELTGRIVEDDSSVPERTGEYWYYSRLEAAQEYPIHCRKKVSGGAVEQVYLDENVLAEGCDYFDLAALSVCPHHRLVAFVVDVHGDERYRLHIKDIDRGRLVGPEIIDVGDDLAWLNDGTTLLYTRADTSGRTFAVYAHQLGTRPHDDVLLFREKDTAFFVNVWKSRSKRYVFIESHSNSTSEVRYLTADHLHSEPLMFRARRPEIEYYVDHQGDRFLILTNENAPNYRVCEALVDSPDFWQQWLPERADTTLEYIETFANHVVIGETQGGVEQIRVIDIRTRESHLVKLPEPFYAVDVEDIDAYDTQTVRINYSSPITPDQVFDYHMRTRERTYRKQQNVPGYDPASYVSRRLYAPALDDTPVPISVLHRKGIVFDGTHPLLLIGYGAYEECLDVNFETDYLSLLDRGVIIALAHVRGGGEMGYAWHEQGRLQSKENSFNDFLRCAEYLAQTGHTALGNIIAWGASAGGLLVAVAAQRRPEWFAAVVAEMPFVDVVNTLLDKSLSLTMNDFDEFGDPSKQEDYRYLLRYSPYDNVCAQVYPPLLVTAGLNDQRVGFWEPLKWVARLRACKKDDNPLLLRVADTGHYGDTGRYQELRHAAFVYAFMLTAWGLAGRSAANLCDGEKG